MYKINFKTPVHIHFMGIGGISMSGLAEILLKENFVISGSDMAETPLTNKLSDLGATIFYGQVATNISTNIDVVVYTAAIHPENEELLEAKRRNIPLLSRAELLGQLMTNYKTPIAVSGTHGKTTTTSMLAHVLLQGEVDPTISVGGILKKIGGNIRVGQSDIFLTEACEYTNSFLSFLPKISIILNVEEDHMDFFHNLEHILDSFHRFASLLPSDGYLIVNNEIKGLDTITKDLKCNVITYGLHGTCDYSASNIVFDEMGCATFELLKKQKSVRKITLAVTGEHNVENALATVATADLLGLSLDTTQAGILSFLGTDRRFEYKGEVNGVTIIDDYAHHPTEIHATLTAARNYPHQDIWCIFQPHTYTRTKSFFNQFVESLALADHVILADIYAARETDTLGVSSEQIMQALKEKNCDAYYFDSFEKIQSFIKINCKKGDLLITMGAGNVVDIGDAILGG